MKFNLNKLIVLGIFAAFVFFSIATISSDAKSDSKTIARFGVDGNSPRYINIINEIGDGHTSVNGIHWGAIEPNPPKGGVHTYRWDLMDKRHKVLSNSGRELQINLQITNKWAIEFDKKSKVTDSITKEKRGKEVRIKAEHMSDWKDFVRKFVSRYDIKYLQVGNEVANIWDNSDGYVEALCQASEAAKEVNPDIKIMAAGFNVGNFLSLNERQRKKRMKGPYLKKFNIIKGILSEGEACFDILSMHLNRDYKDIPQAVDWFKKEMSQNNYQKPIWSDDMSSAPFLKDKKRLRKLGLRDKKEIERYRKEQSRLLVKKLVVAFASGVEKVYLSTDVDWFNYFMPQWRNMGLLDIREGAERKPAFFTYKLVVEKLKNFVSAEKINDNVYKFEFNSKKPVYVMWHDRSKKVFDLSDIVNSDKVLVTYIIETNGQKKASVETVLSKNIGLGISPIFVEEIGD